MHINVKTKIQDKVTSECQLNNFLFIIPEILIQWIVQRQRSKTKWPQHLLNEYLKLFIILENFNQGINL
jgi:hypothetical protein